MNSHISSVENTASDYGEDEPEDVYERLLRGSTTAQGLSSRRSLRYRRRIYHSDQLRCLPCVGTAKLGVPSGRRVFAHRVSDLVDSRLVLRPHSGGNSRHARSPNTSAS